MQTAAVAASALMIARAAVAQSNADVAATVDACQHVQSPLARLDCYDRAFPPLGE